MNQIDQFLVRCPKLKLVNLINVILDEAGQSVETKALIPLSLLSKGFGQVILADDPKQLGPVVLLKMNKSGIAIVF